MVMASATAMYVKEILTDVHTESFFIFIHRKWFMKELATGATTTWKWDLGLTELNVVRVVKERGLSMLTKSNASTYNLTLILSFVLSGYINNLMRIKLKMYKNNSGLIAKTKVSKYKKGLCLTEKLMR